MTAAVLSAAGVLCGKKQNVAKWLKISAKWCCFGLAGLVKSSCLKRYYNGIFAYCPTKRLAE
jgi:hypothetical protein